MKVFAASLLAASAFAGTNYLITADSKMTTVNLQTGSASGEFKSTG